MEEKIINKYFSAERKYIYSGNDLIYCGESSLVYRATDIVFGRPVLLKIIKGSGPELNTAETEVRNYCRLGRYTSRIPMIYDVYRENKELFIFMEWINGKSLAKWLLEEHTDHERLKYAIQICYTINILHRHGYQHRDIKPDNIIMGDDASICLIDFNLSTVPKHAYEGSDGYRAPENYPEFSGIYSKKSRSDIFSIGAVLYEMFTGSPPAFMYDLYADKNDVKWQRFTDAKTKNPKIDPKLNDIIIRCLKLDPSERYQNAGQVAYALKGVKI